MAKYRLTEPEYRSSTRVTILGDSGSGIQSHLINDESSMEVTSPRSDGSWRLKSQMYKYPSEEGKENIIFLDTMNIKKTYYLLGETEACDLSLSCSHELRNTDVFILTISSSPKYYSKDINYLTQLLETSALQRHLNEASEIKLVVTDNTSRSKRKKRGEIRIKETKETKEYQEFLTKLKEIVGEDKIEEQSMIFSKEKDAIALRKSLIDAPFRQEKEESQKEKFREYLEKLKGQVDLCKGFEQTDENGIELVAEEEEPRTFKGLSEELDEILSNKDTKDTDSYSAKELADKTQIFFETFKTLLDEHIAYRKKCKKSQTFYKKTRRKISDWWYKLTNQKEKISSYARAKESRKKIRFRFYEEPKKAFSKEKKISGTKRQKIRTP